MAGWIKLHRVIKEHAFFKEKRKFSRLVQAILAGRKTVTHINCDGCQFAFRAILAGRKTVTRRPIGKDKRGEWSAVNDCRNHEYGADVPCYLHREMAVADTSRNIMYPNTGYFAAYLKAHGVKHGDAVMFHEYSSWITGKHSEFRQMKGCPYCNGYPPDVQVEFNRFISKEGLEG